ncbi:hypothetical protein NJ76_23010 [Rhodococcus sp. IITR03]|nr:hypothetical protein NJ76_23010 [Rhodococcus sp. IITR03]
MVRVLTSSSAAQSESVRGSLGSSAIASTIGRTTGDEGTCTISSFSAGASTSITMRSVSERESSPRRSSVSRSSSSRGYVHQSGVRTAAE